MPFTIVVDGPNFINELHRHGKDKDYIMNVLSFPVLHWVIQDQLRIFGLHSHPFLGTEFICSNVERIGEFEEDERKNLLNKLKRQRGVRVRKVGLSSVATRKRKKGARLCSGEEEKGVDMEVFVTMLEMGKGFSHDIVLIARDKDYVPAIRMLTKMGITVVVVGFDDGEFPMELINESYLFIDLQKLLDRMEEEKPRTIDR